MNTNSNYVWKLGLFVLLGVLIFCVTIYFIGQNQKMNFFRYKERGL